MAHAIELMQVGGLVRQAIKLIRGIEVVHNDEEFMMAVFSVFPWFKVIVPFSQPCSTWDVGQVAVSAQAPSNHPLAQGVLLCGLLAIQDWGIGMAMVHGRGCKLASGNRKQY